MKSLRRHLTIQSSIPPEEGWCATIPQLHPNLKTSPTAMLDFDIIDMRTLLKTRLDTLRNLKETAKAAKRSEFPSKTDTGELLANLTLAIRHIEDAHTRLGWALEAYRGES